MTFAFLLSFVPIVGIGLYAILQRRSSKPRREPVYRTQRVYHIDDRGDGGWWYKPQVRNSWWPFYYNFAGYLYKDKADAEKKCKEHAALGPRNQEVK